MLAMIRVLNVNEATKGHVQQIEELYKKFKGGLLADLFNQDEEKLKNPILAELETLELKPITTQNPSKEELQALQKELLSKRKDISQLSLQGKKGGFSHLNSLIEEITGLAKQQQTKNNSERRKEAYFRAKKILDDVDIDVLTANIKKQTSNFSVKNIAELYKLKTPAILGLARAFSLKNEILDCNGNKQKNVTAYLDLIKTALKLDWDEGIISYRIWLRYLSGQVLKLYYMRDLKKTKKKKYQNELPLLLAFLLILIRRIQINS